MTDFTEAAFSYRPGDLLYGQSDSRASVASYVQDLNDQALVYWPGQRHLTETATRASAATYVNEDTAPWSVWT